MTDRRHALSALLGVAFAAGLMQPAVAGTYEQVVENCKQTVGRPIVQACMQALGRNSANLEGCRAKASPSVRACVQKESARTAGSKAAPAAPKADTAVAVSNVRAPTSFVAPPRTIADITAILDKEKPDAAKLAKLRTDAEATPPKAGAVDLAQFYYDRGNARALLARNREALADGQKALEVGRGAIETRQVSRIRQFVGLQYHALGDPKQALAVSQSIVRDGNAPGSQRDA